MSRSNIQQPDLKLDLVLERIVDIPRGHIWAAWTTPELLFTAVISLEPQGSGTKYTVLVMHGDEESCRKHEGMGFHEGWGAAFEQMVGVVRAMQQELSPRGNVDERAFIPSSGRA